MAQTRQSDEDMLKLLPHAPDDDDRLGYAVKYYILFSCLYVV